MQKLCKEIRKKIKGHYEKYRLKKMREEIEKKESLKVCRKRSLPMVTSADYFEERMRIRRTDRSLMLQICQLFYSYLYSHKVARTNPAAEWEPIPKVEYEVQLAIRHLDQ